MNVYARYFEEDNLGFRRDTILQFGDSWDVIGSIILINPGSSSPSDNPIQPEVLEKLLTFQVDNPDSWKKFSIDPTMTQIEKLFNGQFIGQNKSLNGVIQLFNLFNLRNANLNEALGSFKATSNPNIISIKDDITKIGDKPVYFGWGKIVTIEPELNNMAKEVFKVRPQPYLNDKFEDNPFYHPRYLQMGHQRNENVVKVLHNFYYQNQEYTWSGMTAGLKRKELAGAEVQDIFNLSSEGFETKWTLYDDNGKSKRFEIANKRLSLTITHTENGYIGIRYLDMNKIEDSSIQAALIEVLEKFGLELYRKEKAGIIWLGRKRFKDFKGSSVEEISENIVHELGEVVCELEKHPLR